MKALPIEVFLRDDGTGLRVVEGFRQRVISAPRVSVQPKEEWTVSDYQRAAERKLRGSRRLIGELHRWGGSLDGARVLEVGCGPGIDCVLLGLQPVKRVVGIDLELPLHARDDRGVRARRLTRAVLEDAKVTGTVEDILAHLPVRLLPMDATQINFPDASFDVLISRAVLEHVVPVEPAVAETARVVRPGGLIRHAIDPFFWLRGCHKGGLVDIPWAHARLDPAAFRRFVALTEGEDKARKRSRHLEGLNQLGLKEWRALFESGPLEILDWREEPSALAQSLLEQHPDVAESLLDGVTRRDLVHSSIKVWLRKPGG